MQDFSHSPLVAASDNFAKSRRGLLKRAVAGAAALALPPAWMQAALAAEAPVEVDAGTAPVQLAVVRRTIEVKGQAASVYGIRQPDGTPGIRLSEGDAFNVVLGNATREPTSVHWHGLTPPWPSHGA